MASIDRLCKEFGIRHPLEQSTCIGYGRQKPTCGIAVAFHSRSQAVSVLKSIDRDLQEGVGVKMNMLHHLAGLLLCKRWHQGQAEENAQLWKERLRARAQTPSFASTSASSSQSASTRARTPAPKPALESFTDRQLIQEIKRRIQDPQHTELVDEICDLAETLLQDQDESDESNSETCDDEEHISASGSSSASSFVSSETSLETSSEISSESKQPATDREAIRKARIAALAPKSGSTSRALSTPLRRSRSPSPLRQSHVDCIVCMTPYTEDNSEHWECRSCLNRVHMRCFDSWSASQAATGHVRCMHCRAEVPELRER